MSDFSPQSPALLKGALIALTDTPLIPIPSVIPFQYNPATLSRSIEPYAPDDEKAGERGAAAGRAQPGPPTETISLPLELDATDFLEDPGKHPVGSIFGVASPIASIEKMLYPMGDLLGALIGAIGDLLGLGGGHASPVPRSEVPVVLFFWGPSRIVPVRVTSLKIDEQGHTPILYPTLATVTVSMKVLPPSAFERKDRGLSISEEIAIAAYEWTSLNRDVISLAGMVDTIAGMIPD
jgi:hypothetical protein